MRTSLERGAGLLMPISSLPSPFGIGTLGAAAYEFVDWLKRARQKYWQVLPVGPTSYGDSPYQSFSTYAGNMGTAPTSRSPRLRGTPISSIWTPW